jgi:hypothetical protein
MAVYRRSTALRRRGVILALALLSAAGCAGRPDQPDNAHVCALYSSGSSGDEVLVRGNVVALLGSSTGSSGEHEGFLLKLHDQCDLLLRVETNTSITGPVPLHEGERIIVKGQYEDDATGGVIHWTHHDPAGRHVAGYVLAGSKMYQ